MIGNDMALKKGRISLIIVHLSALFPLLEQFRFYLIVLSPNDRHMKNPPYGTEKSRRKAITVREATQRPSQEEDGKRRHL